ncbi:hypothetical protein [uncultured Oscillibacter sp.]|uniref:hypothetical protein n=1 Tax=uncultured Oscillibacter sp. TaxID=876091 RepID=UPI002803B695|nr:hypothetical protein [uncultured Oscillibacter sp.]
MAFTWVESIPTSYLLVISLAMHCFATSSNNRRKAFRNDGFLRRIWLIVLWSNT